jgi:1,2-diacylglycerol 3-beta-glucosyltransferase
MIDLLLAVAAMPVAVAASYLALLTLFSARSRPDLPAAGVPRFDFIVPAHDEEQGIAGTVRALFGVRWPKDAYRVLVVADNCSDATADAARAAGATVIERRDEHRRGKGYALELGFARSRADGFAQAVVVVDADTRASANLLDAFAARLAAGASALQAHYGVSNADAGWRTRLMSIALTLFHGVRSLARERLGLSCGLRGNGMCFTHALLSRVPYDAFSIVEDLEYGIRLGEAGVRVHYVAGAEVHGEMVVSEKASRSQRQRWEGGRKALARAEGWRLLGRALARRDKLLLDLAADLIVPPLARIAGTCAVGLAAGLLFHAALARGLFAYASACLCAYVIRGWVLSGTGARGLLDLALAPAYVAWKTLLAFRPSPRGEWVRTARDGTTR